MSRRRKPARLQGGGPSPRGTESGEAVLAYVAEVHEGVEEADGSLQGAAVEALLDDERGICDTEEGLRWLRLTDTLVQRLEGLRPCPWGSVPGAR